MELSSVWAFLLNNGESKYVGVVHAATRRVLDWLDMNKLHDYCGDAIGSGNVVRVTRDSIAVYWGSRCMCFLKARLCGASGVNNATFPSCHNNGKPTSSPRSTLNSTITLHHYREISKGPTVGTLHLITVSETICWPDVRAPHRELIREHPVQRISLHLEAGDTATPRIYYTFQFNQQYR
jgi:hypothetical protein